MASQERRVIVIEAQDKASPQLQRIDKNMSAMRKNAQAVEKTMRTLRTVFGAMAAALTVEKFIDTVDAMNRLDAQLKAVTGSSTAADAAFNDLLAVSNDLNVSVRASTDLYTKLGRALPTAEHEQLVGSVEAVSRALAVTGAEASTANAVIRQLAQGLGAGALQGDEFVSILEGAPDLLRSWANAAGETTKGMKQLRDEGFFTTESFLQHLPQIRSELETLGEIPVTLAGSFQVLSNQFDAMIRDSKTAGGAVNAMAKAALLLAENLDTVATALIAVGSYFAALKLVAVTEAMYAYVAAAYAATAATATWAAAMKGLMVFLVGPQAIAIAVAAAVTAIIVYWEDLARVGDLASAYFETAYWAIRHWMERIVAAVNAGIAGVLGAMSSMANEIAERWGIAAQTALPGFSDIFGARAAEFNELAITFGRASNSFADAAANAQDFTGKIIEAAKRANVAKESIGGAAESSERLAAGGGAAADALKKMGGAGGKAAQELAKVNKVLVDGQRAIGDYLKSMEQEIELAQLSDEQRRVRQAQMKIEERSLDALMRASDAAAQGQDAVAESYRQVAEAWRAAEPEAVRLTQELYALESASKSQTGAADLVAQAWKDAAGRIQDSMQTAFKDLFSGSLESAGDFVKKLKDIVLDAIYELVAQVASQRIVVPIIGAVGGVLGMEQAAAGVTGELVGQTGVTGGFGLPGVGGLLSPITNALGVGSLSELVGIGIAKSLAAFGMSASTAMTIGTFAMNAIPVIGTALAAFSLFGGSFFGDKTKTRAQTVMVPWPASPATGHFFEDNVYEVSDVTGWSFGLGGKSHGVNAEEWRDALKYFADTADIIGEFLGPDVVAQIDARIEQIHTQMKGIGLAIDTGDAEAAFQHFFGQIAQFAGETGEETGLKFKQAWDAAAGDMEKLSQILGVFAAQVEIVEKVAEDMGTDAAERLAAQFDRAWEIAAGDTQALAALTQILTAQAQIIAQVFETAGEEIANKLQSEFDAALEKVGANVDSISAAGETLLAATNAIVAFEGQVRPEVLSAALSLMLESYDALADSEEAFGAVLGTILGAMEALSQVEHLLVDPAQAVAFLDAEFERLGGDIEKFAKALDAAVAGMLKLEEFVNADILTDFTDAWRAQNETMWEGIKRLDSHIQSWNWTLAETLDDIAKAGEMVEERYQLELELLAFIDGALRDIKATAEAAREQILLTNATDSQQYEYYRQQADYYTSMLEQTSDPELVAKYGDLAIEAALKAWNLLPADLQAQNQLDFLNFIDYIESSVTTKLEAAAATSLSQLEISQQQVEALLGLEETNREISDGIQELLGLTNELLVSQRANQEHNYVTSVHAVEQTNQARAATAELSEISDTLRSGTYGS